HALADGWALPVEALRYAPVGGGSYHWAVTSSPGEQWFVTVDDLDDKGWLGRTRPAVFAGLRAALDASVTLRRGAGLRFVAAPVPPGSCWPERPGRCAAGWTPWTGGPAPRRPRRTS